MRGENVPKSQETDRSGRRLKLIRTPDRGDGRQASVDYSRQPIQVPLNITPPVLSRPGERDTPQDGREVRRISTLTPPVGVPQRSEDSGASEKSVRTHRREALREARNRQRKSNREKQYRRRRWLVALLIAVIVVAVAATVAVVVLSSGQEEVAISPDAPGDTRVAEAAGLPLVVPVRPDSVNGFGYHAEGENFVALDPVGRNFGSPFAFLPFGSTPGDVGYHVMSDSGRSGSDTGALDIGAERGTEVFAPVTGLVTSIRPDTRISNANIVEIQPTENPDLRVYVTLVSTEDGDIGVKSPVEAGRTKLGTVVDSASVLDPQLAEYTGKDGNHVTVFVSATG